ncbi:hypothetical protein MMC06_006337 [Schaereria dolodes]|nr:hypothetical protein [Schaereria dolodes]
MDKLHYDMNWHRELEDNPAVTYLEIQILDQPGVAAYNAVEEEPPVIYNEANIINKSVTSGYVEGDKGSEPSGYYASDLNIDYYEPESYNQPSEADDSNELVAQLATVDAIKTIQTP